MKSPSHRSPEPLTRPRLSQMFDSKKQLTTVIIAGCILVALAIALSGGDYLQVEKPSWMAKPPSSSIMEPKDSPSPTLASGPVDGSDRSLMPSDLLSGIKEMLPPESLASALRQADSKITFAADALLDGGLARDVAEGVTRVAEKIWRSHQIDTSLMAAGKIPPRQLEATERNMSGDAYFLALWPDLGELIRARKLTLKIIAIPPESRVPRNVLVKDYSVDREEFGFHVNTDKWQVIFGSFNLTAKDVPCPDVLRHVVRVHQRAFDQNPQIK